MAEQLALVATLVGILTGVLSVVFGWPAFHEWWRGRRAPSDVGRQQTPATLATVLATRTLRVGCIPFPPLIRCSDGRAEGIYATLLDDLGARHGLDVAYTPVRNDDAMAQLLGGEVDVIACLLETPERARQADFTARLHTMTICGVVRRDQDRVVRQNDLRRPEVRAVVVEGEIGAEVARRHFQMTTTNGRLTEIDTDEVPMIFAQVLTGHADIAITDGVTCHDYLNRNPRMADELRVVFDTEPLLAVPCGLMIRPGEPDFEDWLESGVAEAARGEAASMLNRDLTSRYGAALRPL